jgi:hypothetical protein
MTIILKQKQSDICNLTHSEKMTNDMIGAPIHNLFVKPSVRKESNDSENNEINRNCIVQSFGAWGRGKVAVRQAC